VETLTLSIPYHIDYGVSRVSVVVVAVKLPVVVVGEVDSRTSDNPGEHVSAYISVILGWVNVALLELGTHTRA
jgi:hypothetical protein